MNKNKKKNDKSLTQDIDKQAINGKEFKQFLKSCSNEDFDVQSQQKLYQLGVELQNGTARIPGQLREHDELRSKIVNYISQDLGGRINEGEQERFINEELNNISDDLTRFVRDYLENEKQGLPKQNQQLTYADQKMTVGDFGAATRHINAAAMLAEISVDSGDEAYEVLKLNSEQISEWVRFINSQLGKSEDRNDQALQKLHAILDGLPDNIARSFVNRDLDANVRDSITA